MVRLFVYGTLKRDCWNHRLLTNARFLGRAIAKGYTLHINGIPYMLRSANGCIVYGEVYEVERELIKELDRFEAGYSRELITVEFEDGRKIRAYAYLADTLVPITTCLNSNYPC